MVAIYFQPTKLPRTWTKTQWKEASRWVRVTQKEIEQQNQASLRWLHEFGDKHTEIKRQIIAELVNPPLLLGPGMELLKHDLR